MAIKQNQYEKSIKVSDYMLLKQDEEIKQNKDVKLKSLLLATWDSADLNFIRRRSSNQQKYHKTGSLNRKS